VPGFETHFQPLFDKDKNLIGVWLSPELWRKAETTLSPAIDKALAELDPSSIPEPPENLKDWELLAQYWDFQYPLPTDVRCEHCGSDTEDWQQDEPRKFKLRSATIGGLANFECLACRSRIIKKHFKHKVDVQCRPYVEKK
jgi:hypothetical protein